MPIMKIWENTNLDKLNVGIMLTKNKVSAMGCRSKTKPKRFSLEKAG